MKPYPPLKIVCFGDSITTTHTGLDRYSTYFQDLVGDCAQVFHKGKAGDTTAHMLARLAADVLAFTPDDCLILGGVNDVVADVAASTIESNLDAMYGQCIAAGITPRPILILPFGGAIGWTAPREAVRVAVNLWIQEQGLAHISAEVALGAFTLRGQPKLASAYANADGLHPSIAGSKRLAQVVAQQGYSDGPLGKRIAGSI